MNAGLKRKSASSIFWALFIAGFMLLIVGLLARVSFVEGLGVGLAAVMGFALVVLKRKS